MLNWLNANIGTISVAIVIFSVIAFVSVKLIYDRIKRKTVCGCGCSQCPLSKKCSGKSGEN